MSYFGLQAIEDELFAGRRQKSLQPEAEKARAQEESVRQVFFYV